MDKHQHSAAPHWSTIGINPEVVLEQLWESSLVGLTLVGADGKFVHPSPVLCEMLEYTVRELEQLTYMDITHPADVANDVGMAQAVLRGEVPYYVMAKRYLTKTGKVIWIKLHVSAFFDEESGEFMMYLAQIAPAEYFQPKVPATRRLPMETRIRDFLTRNWKWLWATAPAAGYGIYEFAKLVEILLDAARKAQEAGG